MANDSLHGKRAKARAGGQNNRTRIASIFAGGVGGMVPLLAKLAGGEFGQFGLLEGGAGAYATGFSLRLLFFFVLGAFLVWLHTDVRKRYAAFTLGITAPALLATALATNAGESPNVKSDIEKPAPEAKVALLDVGARPLVMSDALPPNVFFGKQLPDCTIIDGFLGRKCK